MLFPTYPGNPAANSISTHCQREEISDMSKRQKKPREFPLDYDGGDGGDIIRRRLQAWGS